MRRFIACMLTLAVAASATGCGARIDARVVLAGRVDDNLVVVSAPSLASRAATGTAFLGIGGASRLQAVPVRVGDKVRAGDVLAVFDTSALAARVDAARAAWRLASAREGVIGARIEDLTDARATIEDNRQQVRDAIAQLTSTRRDLALKLDEARSQLKTLLQLQTKLSAIPAPGSLPSGVPMPPPPAGVPNPQQLAAGIAKLETAIGQMEAGLSRIDTGLAKARAGLAKLESADAKAADARDTLRGLKQVAGIAAGVSAVGIEIAQARLDLALLTAPVAGTVVYARHAGEAALPASPVVVLRPHSPSAVTVYLTPAERSTVRLGDPARVSIDSMPGSFSATVTYVAERAQYPPSWLTTTETHMSRAFPARVTLDDASTHLPAGTPADVEIEGSGRQSGGRSR